jgi:flavin-binding protein dodecin
MTVASVTEISAVSDRGFGDALRTGINRATETFTGVEGCWVKDMNVIIEDSEITGYRVNMEITFLLEDSAERGRRIVPRLRRAGYDVTYREFDGGHTVPPEIALDAASRFARKGSGGEGRASP